MQGRAARIYLTVLLVVIPLFASVNFKTLHIKSDRDPKKLSLMVLLRRDINSLLLIFA